MKTFHYPSDFAKELHEAGYLTDLEKSNCEKHREIIKLKKKIKQLQDEINKRTDMPN